MPVSHIGLTVTHLPTSTSFYLSALAPLGYKFIAEHGTQIGFGPAHSDEADFFISQEGDGYVLMSPPRGSPSSFTAYTK